MVAKFLLMMIVWTSGPMAPEVRVVQVTSLQTQESCEALRGEAQRFTSEAKAENDALQGIHFGFWCHQDLVPGFKIPKAQPAP